MNYGDFGEIAKFATARCITTPGQISHLLLTQHGANSPDGRIREPEIRHAFAQECERRELYYGIEVPTSLKYRFTDEPGEGTVAARHDFVLFETARPNAIEAPQPLVLMEFKADQPAARRGEGVVVDFPAITKDLKKLLQEPFAPGRCMFHVLYAADAGTLPALLEKYRLAWECARLEGPEFPAGAWFAFYVFVQHVNANERRPMLYFNATGSIANVNPATFFNLTQLGTPPLPHDPLCY